MTFYKKDRKFDHMDAVRADLGKNHDEVAERVLMETKMLARKKAEMKLERIRLMKEIDLY